MGVGQCAGDLSVSFLLVVPIESEDAVFEVVDDPQCIVQFVGKRTAADPGDTARFGLRCDRSRGEDRPSSRLILRNSAAIVAEPPQELLRRVTPKSMYSLVVVAVGRILEIVSVLAPNALEDCTVMLFVLKALFLRQAFEVGELEEGWFRDRVYGVVEGFHVERAQDRSVVECKC